MPHKNERVELAMQILDCRRKLRLAVWDDATIENIRAEEGYHQAGSRAVYAPIHHRSKASSFVMRKLPQSIRAARWILKEWICCMAAALSQSAWSVAMMMPHAIRQLATARPASKTATLRQFKFSSIGPREV